MIPNQVSHGPSVDDDGIPSGILMSHHSAGYALVFCRTLKGYTVLQCPFLLFFGDDTMLLQLFW